MKSIEVKIISAILLALACLYLAGVVTKLTNIETYAKASAIIVFAYFYFKHSKRKNLFFGGALLFFALSEVSKIYFNYKYELFSDLTNSFSVVAYSLLIFYILNNINVLDLVKKYWFHSIFLIIFSSYIIYNLNTIIFPNGTVRMLSFQFLNEALYNTAVLTLISLSLLNFLYHDDKRSLLLFIISIFFGLAEIVQVPYLFLYSKPSLHVAYAFLYLLGYYFVYIYITTRYNKQYKILND